MTKTSICQAEKLENYGISAIIQKLFKVQPKCLVCRWNTVKSLHTSVKFSARFETITKNETKPPDSPAETKEI